MARSPESEDLDPVRIERTAMFGRTDEPQPEASRLLLPGDTFGRYRIERVLGEGAMGNVYQARDTQLSRKVALKIPKSTAQKDSKFIVRFMREARSAATLSHPNICPVYDVGELDGIHFITMAYIQGHPLSEYVNPDKPQRNRTVAGVVRKIALALHEAHINGLVHRDVKPANIMVDHRNEPIIMDFGLARAIDSGEDPRLTKDGTILGSPAYMSPEQIEGRHDRIGPACDIYSLGIILYELLTGRLPFKGSIASIIAQIIASPPEDPRKQRDDISPRLAAICLKATSKKIGDRYASMKDFAQAVAEYMKSPNEPAPERQKGTTAREKKSETDSNDGLELTAPKLQVSCPCGQKLSAAHHLAGKSVKCPRCGEPVALPGVAKRSTQTSITVGCDGCGQRFMARGALAGKVVKCTTCGRPIAVPRPGETVSRQIEVSCSCGQQFLAKATLAGKRVKCTTCGNPLAIPN